MPKLNPHLRQSFKEYVDSASNSAESLEFLLENLGYTVNLDYSRESLIKLESIFWEIEEQNIPEGLGTKSSLADLMGQYLGMAVINATGAKWVQSKEQNFTFGQPCIAGFGNEEWDVIYPVDLANSLPTIKRDKPRFPGVSSKTVLATRFDKALRIYDKSRR